MKLFTFSMVTWQPDLSTDRYIVNSENLLSVPIFHWHTEFKRNICQRLHVGTLQNSLKG